MLAIELPTISVTELVLRLGLVVVLCGAIGLERELRGHRSSLRTNILVGMGAAVFTMVSAYGLSGVADRPGEISLDPSRIAAQVVSGIGFLGGGVIIQQGVSVRGLTTAAAIWIAAAIGMAAAVGFYTLAVGGTALVLVALLVLRRLPAGLDRGGSQRDTRPVARAPTPSVVSTTRPITVQAGPGGRISTTAASSNGSSRRATGGP